MKRILAKEWRSAIWPRLSFEPEEIILLEPGDFRDGVREWIQSHEDVSYAWASHYFFKTKDAAMLFKLTFG